MEQNAVEPIECWYCHKQTMTVRPKGDCLQCTECGATQNIGWGGTTRGNKKSKKRYDPRFAVKATDTLVPR